MGGASGLHAHAVCSGAAPRARLLVLALVAVASVRPSIALTSQLEPSTLPSLRAKGAGNEYGLYFGQGDSAAAKAAAAPTADAPHTELRGELMLWVPFEGDGTEQRAYMHDAVHGHVRLLGWQQVSSTPVPGVAAAAATPSMQGFGSGAVISAFGALLPGPTLPFLRVESLQVLTPAEVPLLTRPAAPPGSMASSTASSMESNSTPGSGVGGQRRLAQRKGATPGVNRTIIVIRPMFASTCNGVVTRTGACSEDEWNDVLCANHSRTVRAPPCLPNVHMPYMHGLQHPRCAPRPMLSTHCCTVCSTPCCASHAHTPCARAPTPFARAGGRDAGGVHMGRRDLRLQRRRRYHAACADQVHAAALTDAGLLRRRVDHSE